jgi:hypothetical protein
VRELALHLLDIAENSVAAQAQNITISVFVDTAADRLSMSVQDDGCGMDEELVAKVTDPFVTSRTTRKVGLGLPFLKMAAEACAGSLKIHSKPGKGTIIDVNFRLSHIDRMPLGDLAGTFLSLLIAVPQVNWVFEYRVDYQTFFFESAPIVNELDGIPLTEPSVLGYLRDALEKGVSEVQLAFESSPTN